MKLLCKKFEDPGSGDVNYPAFVQTVDKGNLYCWHCTEISVYALIKNIYILNNQYLIPIYLLCLTCNLCCQ